MQVAARCLKDDGIFLLHTIGGNMSSRSNDPWLDKYIFPGSLIPSLKQVSAASEGLFICEDLHNFGPDYDKTLMAWYENFLKHWDVLKSDYDERFFRMWKYYLLVCAASFRARKNQLWQFVFSKHGIIPNYRSIR
jgi:cyclopropane-fatty-acyl-phospholipid synthase